MDIVSDEILLSEKDRKTLNSETKLSDIHVDSLEEMMIIVTIEAKYKISMSEAEVKKIQTIGDITRYVQYHSNLTPPEPRPLPKLYKN